MAAEPPVEPSTEGTAPAPESTEPPAEAAQSTAVMDAAVAAPEEEAEAVHDDAVDDVFVVWLHYETCRSFNSDDEEQPGVLLPHAA